jgi:hypothetical protein
VTLSDLQAPQPFTQLRLLVSRGAENVMTMNTPGSEQFAATPGVYQIQVIGTLAQPNAATPVAGTFDVEVVELTGNRVLRQFADGVDVLPIHPATQSLLEDVPVEVAQAGDYQVMLTDRAFPVALSNVDLLMVREDGAGVPVTLGGVCTPVCTANFTADEPGVYRLFVVATAAASEEAGLYSLSISGGVGGTALYADSHAVGRLPQPVELALPATAEYTVVATDHATPAPLAQLRVALMQGADQRAVLNTSEGSINTNGAQAGEGKLFVFGNAAEGVGAGAGVYTVAVMRNGQSVHRATHTLPEGYDTAANTGAYLHALDVQTAGDYRLRVRDLVFTTALSRLAVVIVQNGGTRMELRSTDGEAVVGLNPGPAFLAVVGSPQVVGGNSLLGLSLTPLDGGAPLEEWTLGVGPAVSTVNIDVASAGSHDLKIEDLRFPSPFSELAVAVTRGPELITQIYGGGQSISFDAQPGVYTLDVLATPSADAQYATWGFDLSTTPLPPTVTLSAAPTSVNSGSTATLTWSSTDTTSCTASGGWSGVRAGSGSASSAALTANTTFTLNCSGPGGSATASASVNVTAGSSGGGNEARKSGGGGAFGPAALLLLSAMLYTQRRRRCQGRD